MIREQGGMGGEEQVRSESPGKVQIIHSLTEHGKELSIFLYEVKVIGKFEQSRQI